MIWPEKMGIEEVAELNNVSLGAVTNASPIAGHSGKDQTDETKGLSHTVEDKAYSVVIAGTDDRDLEQKPKELSHTFGNKADSDIMADREFGDIAKTRKLAT